MAIEPLAQLEEITLSSNQTIVYSGSGDGWNKITVAVPSDIHNQARTVNPSLNDQTIVPTSSTYSGLSSVQINKVIIDGLSAGNIANGQTVSVGFTGSPSGLTVVTGSYGSDASATPGDLLYGKDAYGANGKISGTIPTNGTASIQINGPTVSVPSGYYPNNAVVSINSAVPGPTSATVDNMGTVSYSVNLPAGYYTAQTVTGVYQLDQFNGQTVTPGQTPVVLATDGKFVIGDITVASVTPGVDPSDASATPSDILEGQTAYTADGKITGTMAEVTPTFDGGTVNGTVTIGVTGTNASFTTTDTSGIAIVTSVDELGTNATRASVLYDGAVNGHITKSDDTIALAQGHISVGTGSKANIKVSGVGTNYINRLTVNSGKSLAISNSGTLNINGGNANQGVQITGKVAIVDQYTVTDASGDLLVPTYNTTTLELTYPSTFTEVGATTATYPTLTGNVTTINGLTIKDASAVHGSSSNYSASATNSYLAKWTSGNTIAQGPRVQILTAVPASTAGYSAGDIVFVVPQ